MINIPVSFGVPANNMVIVALAGILIAVGTLKKATPEVLQKKEKS